MSEFDFLRRFVSEGKAYAGPPREPANVFTPVGLDELRAAEDALGTPFPEALRSFYLAIGGGFLRVSANGLVVRNHPNRVIFPEEVPLLVAGRHELTPEEGFDEGELPFFEVGDQLFLVMRPASACPSGVYWPFGDVIEEDFERFVRRLYFEDPRFFAR